MTKRVLGIALSLLFSSTMVLIMTPNQVEATPGIKKAFDAGYVKTSTSAAFKAATAKAKCNVCHYGKSKKNRNDFGKAISKFTNKKERDAMKLADAMKKAVLEKNADKVTFESLINAGKLPGKEPAE